MQINLIHFERKRLWISVATWPVILRRIVITQRHGIMHQYRHRLFEMIYLVTFLSLNKFKFQHSV